MTYLENRLFLRMMRDDLNVLLGEILAESADRREPKPHDFADGESFERAERSYRADVRMLSGAAAAVVREIVMRGRHQ